jgi:signal transduction histidine kinase
VRRLRGRDDATWLAVGFVVLALAAVGVAGWMLAASQADQRRDLRSRYADRVDVATALVGSLLTVAYNGQRQNAAERYAGPVTPASLDAEVRRGNARYLLVLDSTGTVVAGSARAPAGVSPQRMRVVKAALASPGMYGLGELEGGILESAVAYPTAGGKRILVTGSPVKGFADFLRGSLAPVPQGDSGRTWVFDGAGNIVASVNAPANLKPTPELVSRSLTEREGEFTSPNTGEERFFAAGTIPQTNWRIVAGISRDSLYSTASGGARWTPWFILGLGALSLLGIGVLLRRLLRTRARLRSANESLVDSRLRLEERAAELERSNADLEQFAYAASHDLSEPLRTVAGFSQLLAARYQGRLDADADEMIRFMGDGVDRMQQLIDDLLLYSRVGRAPLKEEVVDLNDALDEARAWLGPAVDDAGASISCDDLPSVRGERGQLAQVFQNLLGNAIKFTAPGVTPAVRVSATASGGEWRITVTDNGIGVDPEQADAIFKMFGRLHPADEFPGTGIGLALVKRIVERHGGRIWVERGSAGGSVFVFTLPDRVRTGSTVAPSPTVVPA